MPQYKIRKAELPDLEVLQEISRTTFVETYASFNTEENMHHYLEVDFGLDQLSKELSNKESEFYLLESENQIIGYIKLNTGKAQTESHELNNLEIERIYVLKEFYGKSLGQVLCDKAIERAEQMKAPSLWLGVWEKNPRAIRFYEKNEFVPFGDHIFLLGDDEQVDILMRRPILIS